MTCLKSPLRFQMLRCQIRFCEPQGRCCHGPCTAAPAPRISAGGLPFFLVPGKYVEMPWHCHPTIPSRPIPSQGPTQNSSNKTLNRSDAQHYEARISNGQPSASEDETSNPPFPALRVALQGGIY